MSTQTPNIGLTKPAGNERPDVDVINDNMDILDTKIGAVGSTDLQSQVTSLWESVSQWTLDISQLSEFSASMYQDGILIYMHNISTVWYVVHIFSGGLYLYKRPNGKDSTVDQTTLLHIAP